MSIQPIRITGDPVLHTKARAVEGFDEALPALIADMVETMRAAPGVGLAAPQIGIPLQVFVWEWEDDDGVLQEGAVINPHLTLLSPAPRHIDDASDLEGCLSVPDARYPLSRSPQVRLTGLRPDGSELSIEAEGWLARIFQHEYDHLQGTLYVDRLRWRDRRAAKKEIKAQGWSRPGHQWTPGIDDFEGSGEETDEA